MNISVLDDKLAGVTDELAKSIKAMTANADVDENTLQALDFLGSEVKNALNTFRIHIIEYLGEK